jgi:MFS family permease
MLRAVRQLERRRRRIPENVRVLAWVSFANDVASELAYPILPLFLTVTLGAPVALVGVVEGIAEGVAVGLRGIAGWLSDRIGGSRRRPWIAWGYGLSALSRPLIAAARHWGMVLGGRVVDRVGKALRTAPRDALIRDSSPEDMRGEVFGYHRAFDTAGAVLGPLAAVALLAVGLTLRQTLWLTIPPALLALLLVSRVREAPAAPEVVPSASGRPTRSFWAVIAVWTVFSLGNSSDVFLILRAHELGLGTTLTVLAYAGYNVVYSALSWPLGALSDRVPRRWVLAAGLLVFALVYVGFAKANAGWQVWPLFAVYGAYIAATDGVAKAWVGDHVVGPFSGTAFGIFSAATGAAVLVASIAAGQVWDHVGPAWVFWMGAIAGVVGALGVVVVDRRVD